MQTAFRSEERFTQEEFRKWLVERPSTDVNRYELIGGCIVMTPPATWVHGGVESALAGRIGEHVRNRALGYTFGSSTGYELPSGETVAPDFSFVSKARLEAGPRPGSGGFLRVVPDLVVEILSPSTRQRDRAEKMDLYARNGVEEYWLVDTERRAVTMVRRAGAGLGAERLFTGGRIASEVLPDLSLDVEDLFADLPAG